MDNLIKKDGERKKVVIGLSGGASSFIAAYLLKIQKYELIGVTILQKSKADTKCFISEEGLKKIKDFCLRLSIPHHIVDADEEYIERVENSWVSKKIEALPWSLTCTPCHQYRMEILYQKMKEFNAPHLSTGHFAKVFRGEYGVTVHSTHDLSLDQSRILHSLSPEILSSLILPLSSLGSSEMEKLTHNFSLAPSAHQSMRCFEGNSKLRLLEDYLTFNVSKEVLEREDTLLSKKEVKLSHVLWSLEVDRSLPFEAFINTHDQSIKVNVYPKTLKNVWIELSTPFHLQEGDELALYNKKGGGAKLILNGIIQFTDRSKAEEEEAEAEALEFVF